MYQNLCLPDMVFFLLFIILFDFSTKPRVEPKMAVLRHPLLGRNISLSGSIIYMRSRHVNRGSYFLLNLLNELRKKR